MPIDLTIKQAPIEPVRCDLLDQCRVRLNVLRLDRIHPIIHGNKWFKLKRNLETMQNLGLKRVVSFGGAYSNHLYALAAAGKHFGLETIGLVRGEICQPLNPVLSFAQQQGMRLIGISRSDYRHKTDKGFLQELESRFGDFYLLPEGGSNLLAVQGCEELVDSFGWQTTDRPRLVALSCGTGATMAGVVSGISKQDDQSNPASVIGVSVLKAGDYLQREVQQWLQRKQLSETAQWQIKENYHCGGYARSTPELTKFLQQFSTFSTIPLEAVYTGKLFFGLFDMISKGEIPAGTEILAIHTGGIVSVKNS